MSFSRLFSSSRHSKATFARISSSCKGQSVGELPSLIIFFPLMVPGVERNTWVADIATQGIQPRTNYALSSADLQFNIARLSQKSDAARVRLVTQWIAIEGLIAGGRFCDCSSQIYILD
jgi:hypothetical protein